MNDTGYGIAAAVIAVAWAHGMISGLMTNAPRPVTIVEAGQSFVCSPVAIWDGDGPIWCAEGPRIRLAGIAAREIDGTCRAGQPCPAATGVAARDALATLLGGATGQKPDGHLTVKGKRLLCVSQGTAKGNRTAAWCSLPNGQQLSCAMIATDTAVRWPRYDPEDRCG